MLLLFDKCCCWCVAIKANPPLFERPLGVEEKLTNLSANFRRSVRSSHCFGLGLNIVPFLALILQFNRDQLETKLFSPTVVALLVCALVERGHRLISRPDFKLA